MRVLLIGGALFMALGLGAAASAHNSEPSPLSDPLNDRGWQLNEEISDEFEGDGIDHEKWAVQGLDGKYNGWKGRAPSQFVPENVLVEDGILKIRSKWEPDYDFFDGKLGDVQYGDPIAPVTTGAVIGKRRFLYGYMEARTKASNSAMTSAFWTLGYQSELDIYEQMGAPKKSDGGIESNTLNTAIHDWRPGKFVGNGMPLNKTFSNKHRMPFKVADDFHVYGAEWGPDILRLYVDGELVHEAGRKEMGENWILTNPLQLYFDSEIFSWLGYPDPSELPADYEIDYVRVWQEPTSEALDQAFFGFEGPLSTFEKPADNPNAIKLNNQQEWRQEWYFHGPANKHFAIAEYEQYFRGKSSLKYTPRGAKAGENLLAFSPFGSIKTKAGDYELSVRIFLPDNADQTVNTTIQFTLEDPWSQLGPVDLSNLPRGEWVRLNLPIRRKSASGAKDRLRFALTENGKVENKATIYFDEISIKPAQ